MASFEALPNETVYLIAAFLRLRRDLATLCLVSKSLNVLLTSSLYQTVYLGLASHVERLIERFAAEDDADSTSSTRFNVSVGVRCLVFDDERYTSNHIREQLLCDDVISRFELVVPRLKNLKAIAWRSHWLPQNTKLFKSFRHHCNDLKRVEIQNWGRYFSSGKDHYAESLFGFKGLHHVSVTSRLIPPGQTNCSQTNVALKYNIPSTGQSRCPPPIIQLIRSCPELEFLELICGDDTSTMSRMWSPNKLLQEVGMALPSLRTLRLGGNMTRHWPIMLSGTFYMRSFMENHPMLRTISFSWKPGLNEDHGLTPESVATLFPSLRHFEGPAFLCVVILGSTLSSQLESLSVLDTRIVRDNWRSTGQEFMHFRGLANATRSLPHLHSLKFYLRTNGNDEEDQLQCRAVNGIARAAPGLKELVMEGMRIDGQLTIIEALRSAPQLRSLTARVLIMTPRILHDLSTTCPMLEELHDTHKPHMRTSWRISRRLNGDVDSYKLEALSV